jgi:hypothetical protein
MLVAMRRVVPDPPGSAAAAERVAARIAAGESFAPRRHRKSSPESA